jgi:aromatic-amino-acid transaminase
MSIFSAIAAAPLDPVVVSIEQFAADPRPGKVNLGVGMYYDGAGQVPLLRAVREAERLVAPGTRPWTYMPVEGLPAFREAVARLILGEGHPILETGRLVAFQTLGGTGALSMAAHLLRQLAPAAAVVTSDPSWPNHFPLFEEVGFTVGTYPYYDPATGGVDFPRASAAIGQLPAGTIVLFQGCCHNPTGADVTHDEWRALADIVAARGLVPVVDLAYQGFGESLDDDAFAVRELAARGLPVIAAISCSKSFALYGERVGALLIVTDEAGQAPRLLDQMKNIARAFHSTPPTHGAALVTAILGSPDLTALWRAEVTEMRERIRGMRHALAARLRGSNSAGDFSFIERQRGLFTFTGLSHDQMQRLKRDFAIYALDNGRLCMTALNERNVGAVADAIREVAAVPAAVPA